MNNVVINMEPDALVKLTYISWRVLHLPLPLQQCTMLRKHDREFEIYGYHRRE